jgi:hypothetical protein
MGIFHLVFSYSGKLTLSVLADRAIMPDPEFYHDCLMASYEELHAAAVPQSSSRKRKAVVTKTKRKTAVKAKATTAAKTRATARRKTTAKAKTKAAKARPRASRRAAGKAKPKLKA